MKNMRGIGEEGFVKKGEVVEKKWEVGVMMKRDGETREHVFWFIG